MLYELVCLCLQIQATKSREEAKSGRVECLKHRPDVILSIFPVLIIMSAHTDFKLYSLSKTQMYRKHSNKYMSMCMSAVNTHKISYFTIHHVTFCYKVIV